MQKLQSISKTALKYAKNIYTTTKYCRKRVKYHKMGCVLVIFIVKLHSNEFFFLKEKYYEMLFLRI